MSYEELTRKLQNALKISGYNIRRDFCALIVEKFQEKHIDFNDNNQLETYITKICDILEKQCENNKSIDKQQIERVIEICTCSGYDFEETTFSVVNAFEVPKYTYNPHLQLYIENNTKCSLLSDPKAKISIFNERYLCVLQRTQRNFKKLKNSEHSFNLQTIDCLLTKSKTNHDTTLYLGALFEIGPGKYNLEDPTGFVELDLTHAKYHGGFFVDNSFVLVHGIYKGDVLQVSTMTLPPGEEYNQSKLCFGNYNYFTNNSKRHLRESDRLKEQLHKNQDRYIYFFSDIWLDNPTTMTRLQSIFDGLQLNPPIALVFMGNFTTESYDINNVNNLKGHFEKLAQLIKEYPAIIENTHFVFIPGLLDPQLTHMLPRFPLPKYVTESFTRQMKYATFATNPCRIQYCNREIVVCCMNLLEKFMENTLNKTAKAEIPQSIARTIISQGHLTPFSLQTVPIYWDYDHVMRLYPLPNLIVIGDQADSYESNYKECTLVSPGPFTKSGFQFKGYNPYTNTIEDCEI